MKIRGWVKQCFCKPPASSLLLPGAFYCSRGIFCMSYWLSIGTSIMVCSLLNAWIFLSYSCSTKKGFLPPQIWCAILCTALGTWNDLSDVISEVSNKSLLKLQMVSCSSSLFSLSSDLATDSCIRQNKFFSFKVHYILNTIAIWQGCQKKLFTSITWND